jgi:hypothetical protein
MTKRAIGLSVCIVALLGALPAEAKQVKYVGIHPRTGKANGGLCHVRAIHVHPVAPASASVLYRVHDGIYFFIGDPVPFGYEGPKHQYYGHHPVTFSVVIGKDLADDQDQVEYCYLEGPHFHFFEPPEDHDFVEKKDVHFYAEEFPPEYEKGKPERSKVNAVYRPIEYARPVYTEAPPAEYRGPIVEVSVALPVPTVGIHLAVPPVLGVVHVHDAHCHDDHHKHKKAHFKHKKFKGNER